MWGGNQQGGGGNEFVFLTGLFASKSGKSITGSIKPDSFNTLFSLMKEADSKGTELVFVVSGPGQSADPNGRMKGRLSVVVGRPQQDRQYANKQAPAGPFGLGGAAQPPTPAQTGPPTTGLAVPAFGAGGTTGQAANNPPKDDLESFLESFDTK